LKHATVIAFLGIDGCGKATQARRLDAWLDDSGTKSHFLEHHSLSPVRDTLDSVALDAGCPDQFAMLGPESVCLYSAVVKLESLLNARPYFEATDRFLVIDRYAECQYAAARATGAGNVSLLRAMFASLSRPDLSLFIDVAPVLAQRRIEARGIDTDTLPFLEAYRGACLSLPEASAFIRIDGDQPEDQVARAIQAAVAHCFPALLAKEPS
jgi:dTMP kinase